MKYEFASVTLWGRMTLAACEEGQTHPTVALNAATQKSKQKSKLWINLIKIHGHTHIRADVCGTARTLIGGRSVWEEAGTDTGFPEGG